MVTTPEGLSTYQRYMVAGWDERDLIGIPRGFQSLFGRPANGGQTLYSDDAEVIDIDVIRGNERTAVLVPRGGIHRTLGSLVESLNEQKFSSQSRVYPLSVETFDIHASQLSKRIAGEKLYEVWPREMRLRVLARKAMAETVRRTARLFERLAAQSARTGKMDAILGTAKSDEQFDWRRNATHTFTPVTLWDAAAPTITADLDQCCDLIRQDGHLPADIALMGVDCFDHFLKDTAIDALADNRRFSFISAGLEVLLPSKYAWMAEAGFDFRGIVSTPAGRKLHLFTYQEGYTDAGGTFVPYMPVDEVLVFSSEARCDRYFGPPETLPLDSAMERFYIDRFGLASSAIPTVGPAANMSLLNPQMFHFDAYSNSNATAITHRTQSAPIFGTVHVDAFVLMEGVVS